MGTAGTSRVEAVRSIIEGSLDDLPNLPLRTVKIYLSSNFSDFELERSILQRDVVPDIQNHCVKYGLDVVWYDVHHGGKIDHAIDAHAFNLHMETINECYRESEGTFFVCLIGNSYGDCPLPVTIEECEFKHIRNEAFEAGKDIRLLDDWYVRDDNNIPPLYILKPVSEKFKNFYRGPENCSGDHQLDVEAWTYTYNTLLDIVQYGAQVAHSEGHINQVHIMKQQRFFNSVLEQEVRQALTNTSERCIYVYRNIEEHDISTEAPRNRNRRRTKEDNARQIRLKQLKQLIDTRVKSSNIFSFSIPRKCSSNATERQDCHQYLENISAAIATKIKDHVDQVVKANQIFHSTDLGRLYLESLLHLDFCKKSFSKFNVSGLEKVLSKAQMFLLSESKGEHYAIVLKGSEHSGKTMFASKVSYRAKELFGKETILITRFVGLTPKSYDAEEVLREICMQLNNVLNQNIVIKNYDFGNLLNYFHGLLNRVARGHRHIVLILDGIEHFKQLKGAEQNCLIDWLSAKLTPKFHMILTYRDDRNPENITHKLERKNSLSKCMISLPEWSVERYKEVLERRLSMQHRKLTKEQENSVLKVIQTQNNTSMRLDQIEAYLVSWHSFSTTDCSGLPSSMTEAVHLELDKLEHLVSRTIVAKIVSYITLSQHGLSEMELLDILSCDNDLVVAEHRRSVQTWLRFPCSLWIQLKHGFGSLLTTRYLHDKRLMWWSSSIVEDTIRHRYMKNSVTIHDQQEDIAHIFSETWLDGKPYVSKEGAQGCSSDVPRLVCPQPLLYSETRYNIRRINELWLQLLQAGDIKNFKKNTLCNFEYLLALAHSSSMLTLLRNFKHTMLYLLDAEIYLLYNSLEASRSILTLYPTQLATEVIGRLKQLQGQFPNYIEQLVCQCMQWCDNYQQALFVPMTSWLPSPHVSHVTSIDNMDGGCVSVPLQNNQHVISSYGLQDIAVYHVPSKKTIKIFSGHHGAIRALCLSNNGHFFVSGSDDSTIRIWKITAAVCVAIIRDHSRAVLCVTLSHGDDLLYSGSEDSTIMVSRVVSGKRLHVLEGHKKAVTSLRLNANGTMLTSASRDMKIIVWCLEDMLQLMCIYDGLHTPILCMDLSLDSTFLLVGCEDSTLNVISYTTGSWIHQLKGHKGWVNHVVISSDSHLAIAGCQDSGVYVYNLRTTELLEHYRGHNASVTYVALSKDQTLIFSSSEGKLNVWSFLNKRTSEVQSDDHSAPVTCLSLGGEDKLALTGSETGEVKVWNLTQNTLLENFPGHAEYISCIKASSDGAFCVTASRDLTVKVWSMSLACVITNYEGHTFMVENLEILEDEIRICSRDSSGHFRIWRADDGETIVFYTLPATDFILSRDNQFLVATNRDNHARVWRTETGILVTNITHADSITCLSCDEQDRYLVTGSADKSCKVWELRTGKLTQVLVEHESEVSQVLITDDRDITVLSGADDGTLIVWTFVKGEAKFKLIGHVGRVMQLKLLSNRNYVVSASQDGSIRLWNILIGQQLTLIDLHLPVRSFVISEDGNRVVVQLEKSTHVPILCLHNCPSQNEDLSDTFSQTEDGDTILPLHPKSPVLRRASFEYPIPQLPSKRRKASDSNNPEIIRLSPIRAPQKPERKFRRPQITVNMSKLRQRKTDNRQSSVCHIL